jgi:tripartite-type tricarboxylate transporter receptor subunit TctC
MALPEIKARLASLGAEPAPLSPEQFDAHIRSEIDKFRKIVASANIKVE